MNKVVAKKLIERREAKHFTQTEMAERLATALNQTYSLRQYQKLEEGKFPKYKKEIVTELDKILGTKLYDLLYEQDIPRENASGSPGDAYEKLSLNDPRENYLQKRREIKNTATAPYMVPLVPVKAQAGYAQSYNSTDFINQLELYPILPGIDPRGAVWRFFEVQGDSMEPGLFNSDLVLVSMVPPADWPDIKKGQVHVIVTHDDVYVKLIYPKDKDTWILTSSNKRHRQKEIAIADVKEVWRYRRHVTNKIQWPK